MPERRLNMREIRAYYSTQIDFLAQAKLNHLVPGQLRNEAQATPNPEERQYKFDLANYLDQWRDWFDRHRLMSLVDQRVRELGAKKNQPPASFTSAPDLPSLTDEPLTIGDHAPGGKPVNFIRKHTASPTIPGVYTEPLAGAHPEGLIGFYYINRQSPQNEKETTETVKLLLYNPEDPHGSLAKIHRLYQSRRYQDRRELYKEIAREMRHEWQVFLKKINRPTWGQTREKLAAKMLPKIKLLQILGIWDKFITSTDWRTIEEVIGILQKADDSFDRDWTSSTGFTIYHHEIGQAFDQVQDY